jgi:putative DNA primase/helicase
VSTIPTRELTQRYGINSYSYIAPNAGYRHFLQRYFGSMLVGSNARETFTILYGPGGSGKSTFMNTIAEALGPYALTTNPDTLQRQGAGAIREDLASFEGKWLVLNPELPEGSTIDPTMVKVLSGQDHIRARKLHRNGRVIRPTWSLVVSANQLPYLSSLPDSG